MRVNDLSLSTDSYIEGAIKLYKVREYQKALNVYEYTLRLDPTCVRAYHGKGLTLVGLKRYKGAVVAFKKAMDLDPQKAEICCDLGSALYELEKYRESGIIYRRAIRINPDLVQQYLELTVKLVNEGKVIGDFGISFDLDEKKNIYLFECAIVFNPIYADAYAEKGKVHFRNWEYVNARNAYKKAVQLDSAYIEVYDSLKQKLLNKGAVLYEKQLYQEAVKACADTILFDPDSSQAYIWLTKAYYELRYYKMAGEVCRQAILLDESIAQVYADLAVLLVASNYEDALVFDPNNALAYIKKADVLYDLKRFEMSGIAYRSAIELNSHYKGLYVERLNMLLNEGKDLYRSQKYREALSSYKQAVEFDLYNAQSYVEQGETLYALKRYMEAGKSYRHAIQLDPSYEQIYLDLGNNLCKEVKKLFEDGLYKDARNTNENLVLFDPTRVYIINQLAHDFLTQGIEFSEKQQYKYALAAFDHALICNPNDADSYIEKGKVFYALEQYYDAYYAYTKAVELDIKKTDIYADQVHTLFEKGNTHFALTDYEKACMVYEQMTIFCPMNAEAFACYGKTLYELERFKLAHSAYKTAITLNPSYKKDVADRGGVLLRTAQSLFVLEKYEEAHLAFENAISFDPSITIDYINCAQSLFKKEKQLHGVNLQSEQVSRIYEKTISFASGDLRKYVDCGKSLREFECYEASLVAFGLAIELGFNTEDVLKEQDRTLTKLRAYHKRFNYLI